jgi:DnaJ-class molecular chaperone
MKDHYSTLGVARGASEAEIKRAYRRLASQHHPDKGGSTEQFQTIEEAYRVLSDPAARQEYDNPRPQPHFGSAGFNLDEIFNMFGTRFQTQARQPVANLQLWITLQDLADPGPRVIAVSSPYGQSQIEIQIPAGIRDGESVRYPRVAPGQQDLVITYRVRPDPTWQRDQNHVIADRVIDIWQAMLGAQIRVPTLRGSEIELSVPAMTQPGTMLRVRGHGLPGRNGASAGDMLVRVSVRLPDDVPDSLLAEIRRATQK